MDQPIWRGMKGTRRLVHRVGAWLALLGIVFSSLALPASVQAAANGQGTPTAQTPWTGCESVAPDALRAELNNVSQAIFAGDPTLLDLDGLVARQWRLVGMDAAIDTAVVAAVAQVRQDTDFWAQFLSGWSPTQAETLTRQVADVAFSSEGFRTAVDTLAAAVAVDLADAVARLSAESAAQATLCLQAYVGERYSAAMVAAFTDGLQSEAAEMELGGDAVVDTGILTVMDRHRSALGGVGVIIATQIAKRVVVRLGETIAKRVAGKLVGRVVGKAGSTVIPAVGWAVGAGMIVYDVIDSRDGALPQIEAGLRDIEVKETIRAEITDAVAAELALEMPVVARDVANDLYAEWLDFQRQYRQLIDLAEQDPAFNELLRAADDPAQAAKLVDVALAALGEEGIAAALADGTLARALDLPEVSYGIIQATGSLASLLGWADLAGSDLDQVVALDLYKHKQPDELSRTQLEGLLALDDPAAVAKLVLVPAAPLGGLLRLANDHVRTLAQTLSADDLMWLGSYLNELTQEQANQLVSALLADPTLINALRDETVQRLVIEADDVGATLAFMTQPAGWVSLFGDMRAVFGGQVSPQLLPAKYGVGSGLAGLALLVLLIAVAASLVKRLWNFVVDPFRARHPAPGR